ncbi:hypothetical protein LJR219_004094 [Phenylobacterium sp. LjRoot219]|uniref:hypothetical protein n=1 Tax=Phenylobacterium sp. LjRoot219 TaxID=3342283 RepID=UPI003ECF05D6
MNTAAAILVALVALAVVLGAVAYVQRRKSQRLRAHYGAEYLVAVDELGDRRKAEAALKQREKRVETFHIRPLSLEEADRFAARWRKVQAEFVDDPRSAIGDADAVLGEVMRVRGYPVSDFEQRADDLSVEHPKLVTHYRIAHEVAVRHARGEADTEDLRQAMIHYRDLFADLVEPPVDSARQDEPRTFREEPEDERAARVRDEEYERDTVHRADRRRRRDRSGDGRTPHV